MKPNLSSPWYIIAYAAVLAGAMTATIVGVDRLLQPQIQQNQAVFEQKALVKAFGLGDTERMTDTKIIEIYNRHIVRDQARTITDPDSGQVYGVIEAWRPSVEAEDRQLVGYAFPIQGVGFWATIRGFVALDPQMERIIGIVFTEHAETPGLGGLITEDWWRDEFHRKLVTPPERAESYIIVGGPPPADPQIRENRYVPAITGATQTSLAVGNFLNEDLRRIRRAAEHAGMLRRASRTRPATAPTTTTTAPATTTAPSDSQASNSPAPGLPLPAVVRTEFCAVCRTWSHTIAPAVRRSHE